MNLPFFWIVVGLVLGIIAEPCVRLPAMWLFVGLGIGIVLLWFERTEIIYSVLCSFNGRDRNSL